MQSNNQYQQQQELPKISHPQSLLDKRLQTSFDDASLTLPDYNFLEKKVKLKSSHRAEPIISTRPTPSASEYQPLETEFPYFKQASAPELPMKNQSIYVNTTPFPSINPLGFPEDLTFHQSMQAYLKALFPQITPETKPKEEEDCVILGRVKPVKKKQQQDFIIIKDDVSVKTKRAKTSRKKNPVKELERRQYWQALEAQELAAYFSKKEFQVASGNSINMNLPALNKNALVNNQTKSLLHNLDTFTSAQSCPFDENINCKYEPSVSTAYSQKDIQKIEFESDSNRLAMKEEDFFVKEEQNDPLKNDIPLTKEEDDK